MTRKLQIAQSLEQSGDWKQAALLYEDLWRTDTSNYVFFDALRRAYGQLKQYEKAIELIRNRLRARPSEFYLASYLGGAYFDAGMRREADSVWNAMLTAQPKQRQLYVLVAQQMQERRLFGRATETYRQGRKATGNAAEFAQELALLYSATQAYGDAVGEYLLLLEQTPHQMGFVQSRIASFTIRDEGLHQAEQAVSAAVARNPAHISFRTLHAWILMEQGRYDDALQTYRVIDSMGRSNGAQLLAFAERATREKRFAEASQAYGDIVSLQPPSPLRPTALYGMAQAYEQAISRQPLAALPVQSSEGPIPETPQSPDSALLLYGKVIQEYPGSQPALQSLFRIGVIRYERLFDLDAALRAFDEIRRDRRSGTLAWESLLISADVLVSKGDVPGAQMLLKTAPAPAREYLQETLTLKQAWIEYLLGSFEQSLSLLQTVIRSLNRDAANDGLELSYHVQTGSIDSASLALFARAELAVRQRKYAEAFELFQAVGLMAKTAMLASRARLESADMLVMVGKDEQAVALLDSVVSTYQTDVLRDRALFRIGTIYEERLEAKERARETYERFLALFPTSLYAEEARRRVRVLRSDPL